MIHVRYARGTHLAQRYPGCSDLGDGIDVHAFMAAAANPFEWHLADDCDEEDR